MHHFLGYVLVFVGGGLGAMLRHGVNNLAMVWLGPSIRPGATRLGMPWLASFPWNTLFVNVVGGLLMGLFAGWFTYRGEQTSQFVRLFLTTGVLGGFTTFSAFTLDAVVLWERGQYLVAGAYVVGSVALAIIGLSGGLAITRSWLG